MPSNTKRSTDWFWGIVAFAWFGFAYRGYVRHSDRWWQDLTFAVASGGIAFLPQKQSRWLVFFVFLLQAVLETYWRKPMLWFSWGIVIVMGGVLYFTRKYF